MSNLKASPFWSATIIAALCLWGISLTVATANEGVSAQTSGDSVSQQHEVTFQRNPDYACTQCHKDEENQLAGTHGEAINPHTNRDMTCIDCHTGITEDHRDGAKDVVKFDHSQSVAGTDIPAASLAWILQQNTQCEACHEPLDLREANWTHDVHARDLTCTSCHDVHPKQDPMKGITRKDNIQLCVDCHSDQTKAREEKE
ncbi:cytochrome c nitrite reductase pentaheme subunit [Enterovibrio sp. ZSDZ42]|uniref:Cytochrome c nitrite reductase pentaheme subunit n=1 Tax=Enterovibrio gelatinilyticus TaxID=2899819 RepID=A0ABT5R493_9GAMM|nr:cytochrome c nitrite reductase pentaheme subunit [Enterovibrio sp. ZSDZ42]MDD1795076.1 cytochrome c nitrite reductase pentaheme subunit [Enterovibrio sp. ZSDZ42]